MQDFYVVTENKCQWRGWGRGHLVGFDEVPRLLLQISLMDGAES